MKCAMAVMEGNIIAIHAPLLNQGNGNSNSSSRAALMNRAAHSVAAIEVGAYPVVVGGAADQFTMLISQTWRLAKKKKKIFVKMHST